MNNSILYATAMLLLSLLIGVSASASEAGVCGTFYSVNQGSFLVTDDGRELELRESDETTKKFLHDNARQRIARICVIGDLINGNQLFIGTITSVQR